MAVRERLASILYSKLPLAERWHSLNAEIQQLNRGPLMLMEMNSLARVIRKGRARWVAKEDAVGQALFIAGLFGFAA